MKVLRRQAAFAAMIGLVVLVALGWGRSSERMGDGFQIALPLAGLGCAVADGGAGRYILRYLLLEAGIKLPKLLAGDEGFALRPDGGRGGFPSGHTAAAAFGAAGLAETCLRHSRAAQAVAVLAAGFTGGTRIEARQHTLWQVLAGAAWGWFAQAAALGALDRGVARIARRFGWRGKRSR